MSQYKNQNENIFKKNTKEIKNSFTESYYNKIENGLNSTKSNSSANKEKISQNVLNYKENTKKSESDFGDAKNIRNIKFNCLDHKRNFDNKFVDIYSSNKTSFFDF